MVAAIVLVGLVFAAAFLVADAEESTLDRIKVQAPTVKRWGGRILIASACGSWRSRCSPTSSLGSSPWDAERTSDRGAVLYVMSTPSKERIDGSPPASATSMRTA